MNEEQRRRLEKSDEEVREANKRLSDEIAARERIEAALRRSDELARTLFRAVPVPTFTWRRHGDVFRLEDYNDAGLRMVGGLIKGLVGKTAREVHADRPDIQADMRRCCESGETIERRMAYKARIGETWQLDVKYVRAEPDLVMVHTENITSRVLAEQELERHRAGLELLVRQRTRDLELTNVRLQREAEEHDRAKRILAESESRYRAVSDMISDYIFVAVLRPDGSLEREWVAGAFEEITGYSSAELKEELPVLGAVHPDDRHIIQPLIRSVLAGNRTENEFRIVNKNGAVRWIRSTVQPLPPSPAGWPRALAAVKDITEHKLAQIELDRRNRELLIVNRIWEIFNMLSERSAILPQALEAIHSGSAALAAGLGLPDRERGVLELERVLGIPEAFAEFDGVSLGDAPVAAILAADGVTVLGQKAPLGAAQGAEAMGVTCTAAFAVIVGGEAIAVFLAGFGGGCELDPGMRQVLEIARDQLVLQFDRLELRAETQRYERQLKKLANSLIEALEKERNLIALKLHDELGQTIVALNAEILLLESRLGSCDAAVGEIFNQLKQQLRELTQSTRQLSYSLHPSMLDDLGLVPTLRWYIDKFIRGAELAVELETAGIEERLSEEVALTIYRVAQEALTNVVKHSGARSVSVKLIRGYPDLIMVIEDDGKGFVPAGEHAPGRGLGIVGMRERVERMGGRFRIASVPGRGTRIRVTLPMEVDDEQDQGAARG